MNNLATIPCLFLLPLTLACSSNTADPLVDSDGGTTSGCLETKDSTTIALETIPSGTGSTLDTYRLGRLTSNQDGALLSMHRDRLDESVEVASWDGSDAISSLVSELDSSASQIRTAAVDFGQGKQCALYEGTPKSLSLACNDGTVEESSFSVRQQRLYPVVNNGALSVFTQTYASYTEIYRSPSGQWREIEKYESSVSMPTDAHLVDGSTMTCFVSTSDLAVIDFGGGETLSAAKASDCRLAPTSTVVHILTDEGYATLPRTSLGTGERFETTPVELEGRLLTFLAVGDVAYAIVLRDQEIVALSMPDGAVHPILSVEGSQDQEVSYDATGEKLYIASSTIENPIDTPTQRLDLETLCLGELL